MKLHLIGYAGLAYEEFEELLVENSIRTLVDVRRWPQYGGVYSKESLQGRLPELEIEYEAYPDMGPSEQLLIDYSEDKISWEAFKQRYKEERKPT